MEEKEKIKVNIDDDVVNEKVEVQDTKEKGKKNKKVYDIDSDDRYIEKLEEIATLKDQLLRKQAEFENFRKRTNEERIKDRKYALQDFLTELIVINDKIMSILNDYDVKKIECLNKPFDDSLMSATESVEKEGVEPNTVVEVEMNGYTYKDRVLRYARVKVSK